MLLPIRALALVVLAACAAPPPPPTLIVASRARGVHPGEVIILTITADAPLTAVRARAFDRALPPVQVGAAWRVLVGIDLDVAPGTHVVTIEADSATALATTTYDLVVTGKSFPTRRLTVDPDFVNPPASMAARIAEESKIINAIWSAPPTAPPTPELIFTAPVPHRANSAFGTRSIFNGEPRGAHSGADFLSPTGTPVRAPAPGTVVLARDLYYSGGSVVIDHGLGLFSFLAHFSAITAKVGDVVKSGDIVGRVGATGRVTGPHLHWTARLNNARVDPLALLELLTPQAGSTDARLQRFLTQQPEFRVITAQDVEPDGSALVKAGHFSSVLVGTVRPGGASSTLAVVATTRSGARQVGLVELHGERPEVEWVIAPGSADLLSVHLKGTQVWPMICYGCDSGSFHRWNGHAWEFELWAPGDVAFIGVVDDPPVTLREKPSIDAPVVARVPTCRDDRAQVLAVGSGEGRDRWYRIRVPHDAKAGTGTEGFVRGRDLGTGQDCIG